MADDLDFEYQMLTRRALRQLKAEVWDEACEHDISTCRDKCSYNPYRDRTEETA